MHFKGKNVIFRCPERLKEDLRKEAKKQKTSMSQILRRILIRYIDSQNISNAKMEV